MSDIQRLMPNAYFAHKYKFMMKQNDFTTLIELDTNKEMKNFLKRFKYDVEESFMHSINSVDEWYQTETKQLYSQFCEFDCQHLLDTLWIEELAAQHRDKQKSNYEFDLNILKTYASVSESTSEAIQDYCKVKIDQILLMRYLRTGKNDDKFLLYAKGNIHKDLFKRLSYGKDEVLTTVLESAYGNEFRRGLNSFFDDKQIFWIDQTFEKLITKYVAHYRFQTIGENGLFAYIYAYCEELKNIRMIIKSRLYYLNKDLQTKMVRDPYV